MEKNEKVVSENEKLKYLYHASKNSIIDVLVPQTKSWRDPNEWPVVFGTPNVQYVSMFLVKTDDSWSIKGRMNSIYYTVISDKSRFLNEDKWGTIYTLPNKTFYCDPKKGMGEQEWVSKDPVTPFKKEHYKSGLDAMINNWVQVYFVDNETFLRIKKSKDHGLSILKSIESENKKLNRNILPFK